MLLSTAAGAKPAFFSRNWINRDSRLYGTLTASENSLLAKRLIDGDPLSIWAGSNIVDGTPVTITASLNNREIKPGRAVDLLLFQNVNWKRFLVEYSNDGQDSWSTIPGGDYTSTDFSEQDFRLVRNDQDGDTTDVRVTITHTQTPNEAKKCGGIIAAQLIAQLTRGDALCSPAYRENVNRIILANGDESAEYMLRSAQSYIWWGRSSRFDGLSESEIATLFSIKVGGLPFIYYPLPGRNTREAYLCRFGPGWAPRPFSKNSEAGFSLPVELRETRG